VVVDSNVRTVTITTRSWWFRTKTRVVPFERIDDITSTAGEQEVGWPSPIDTFERHVVTLELGRPYEWVPLISFVGEGSKLTGWSGVMLFGDGLVDLRGDQAESSARFVVLLRQRILHQRG
jgi:hypothetical protein